MIYLQLRSISGGRLINLFRLLGLVGLFSFPFQTDFRTQTNQSLLTLSDGSQVKGVIQEYSVLGKVFGYQIRQLESTEVPKLLKGFANGVYLVSSADVKSVEPVYSFNVKGLLLLPFRLLLIFNMVWIFHLPALLFWFIYEIAGLWATILNWIYALSTQKNHPELSRFLVRVLLYRFKFLISLNTEQLPNIDIHNRERTKLPVQLTATIAPELAWFQIMIRLIVTGVFFAIYVKWSIVAGVLTGPIMLYVAFSILGLLLLPFALFLPGQILSWIFLSLNKSVPNWLIEIMYRPFKFLSCLQYWWQGLSSDTKIIKTSFSSVLSSGNGSFDAAQSEKIEMNLLVLFLLSIVSVGLYTLVWLSRTAKLMSDDAFTILVVTVLAGFLPLSFIMVRYYRRSEVMMKTPPSLLFEFLMLLPGLNLILGPFLIQHGLNLVAKSQAKSV